MPSIRAPPIVVEEADHVLVFNSAIPNPHRRIIQMQIMLINNDGGGFADHIEIAEGTSVSALFVERIPDRKTADYLIRVNRLPVTGDQVLQPGDRVSITPTKVEGAYSL
jgi:hypothetical protein